MDQQSQIDDMDGRLKKEAEAILAEAEEVQLRRMENELREAKGYFLEKEIKFEKKQKEVIIKRRQEFNKQQTELDVKEEELREFDDSLSSTFLAFGGGRGLGSWLTLSPTALPPSTMPVCLYPSAMVIHAPEPQAASRYSHSEKAEESPSHYNAPRKRKVGSTGGEGGAGGESAFIYPGPAPSLSTFTPPQAPTFSMVAPTKYQTADEPHVVVAATMPPPKVAMASSTGSVIGALSYRRIQGSTSVPINRVGARTGSVKPAGFFHGVGRFIAKDLLRLLSHAKKCRARDSQCTFVAGCQAAKRLLQHMPGCKDHQCKIPHCAPSKFVLNIHYGCKDSACGDCAHARGAFAELIQKRWTRASCQRRSSVQRQNRDKVKLRRKVSARAVQKQKLGAQHGSMADQAVQVLQQQQLFPQSPALAQAGGTCTQNTQQSPTTSVVVKKEHRKRKATAESSATEPLPANEGGSSAEPNGTQHCRLYKGGAGPAPHFSCSQLPASTPNSAACSSPVAALQAAAAASAAAANGGG